MSWQEYVDNHLLSDIEFKPEEITGIMNDFNEPGTLAPTGLYLGEKIKKINFDSNPMSGSSSSSAAAAAVMAPPPTKYDVFLSFRGQDTRKNFTSHLHAALRRKNVETFIDDRSLETGDEISPELNKAIEQSMIYVIIFSENYASSSWCLNELVKILECKKKYDHQRHVIPIFYHVDPATVRYQKVGSYADAFEKHQNRFSTEVIQRWKVALTQAANLSGLDANAASTEFNFVDDIAQDVLKKLDRSISSDSDDKRMVGIDEHIAQIKPLLQLESEAVRIIGIWGMGGIGKTTLARALYGKLGNQFSSRCLVENAQQEIDRDGTYSLRQKHLSQLGFSDERLKRAKVLLILDDVKISSQIQELIGGHGNFGQGSRIIVTSRDLQVLKNANADAVYEVNGMSYQDSMKLLCLNAFKQDYPLEGYKNMVQSGLKYAKGVPLALQVLGSLLYDKKREVWESQLQKLRKLPNRQIINVLKLSYDGLDDEEKDIFLDIACLFVDRYEYEVVNFIDACGFYAEVGMDVLKDRGLISIVKNKVVVHDLLREMGKDIVHQQCANDPGKRSRLWDKGEIYHVLRNNKGTNAIQCIFLYAYSDVQLHPGIFKSMPNLRMLTLNSFGMQSKFILSAFLESLPDGLKSLHWNGFGQRSLPLCPENLVELYMPYSKLEQLWEDDQELPNLKRLDLSDSDNLIRIPDLSMFPNIEEIFLGRCGSLTEVHSSSVLNKLKCLWLIDCVELTNLNVLRNMRSSRSVWLYKCRKLKTFSISSTEVVESRGVSHFGGFSGAKDRGYIDELESLRKSRPSPSSHELCLIDLGNCESLTSLPFDLCELKLLKKLCLSGCSNLKTFPEIEYTVENLAVLILDKTAIQELPSSLHRLVGLEELSLRNCSRLEIIPSSIGRLTRLCKLYLTDCESLETFPSSIFKLKLAELNLYGCTRLKTFPEILESAESFVKIRLGKTRIKKLPSSFDCLVGLQNLQLRFSLHLESLPNSIVNLNLLSELDCSFCRNLTEIPNDIGRLSSLRNLNLGYTRIVNLPESIGQLSSLKSLDLNGTGVVNLPESVAHLSSLESLDVSYCKKLVCIPQLPPSLEVLSAFECPSIRRVISNSTFKYPSDSIKRTFKFYFTSDEDQYPSAYSDVVADARIRISEDAYRFVFYCFPGSVVPGWFPYRCKGDSVTVDKDSLNWCNDNRLIGFALCVVLPHRKSNLAVWLECSITVKSDGRTFTLPQEDQLKVSFGTYASKIRQRDRTFLWKSYLTDSVNEGIFHASIFTFNITESWSRKPSYEVKECGICPLYTKEKYDIDGLVDSLRISNNDLEEP